MARVTWYTTEVRACYEGVSFAAYSDFERSLKSTRECSIVELPYIAPVLSYSYTAGAVALALGIVLLGLSLAAGWLTLLRRAGTLHVLPTGLKVRACG